MTWRRCCAGLCLLLVSLVASRSHGQQPAPQPDGREMEARQMFGVGRYAEALEIYGKLYAETAHPTYLRNIGRCYQNLGDPDKAISSFREHLRQARDLPPDQRAQVEGYIREMEELQRKRAAASHPPAPPPVAPRPPPSATTSAPPAFVAPPPPVPAATPSPPPAVVAAPATSDAGQPPAGARTGRRTAAYVVGGASVAALAVGAFFGVRAISKRGASDPHCPMNMCDDTGYELNEQAKTAARLSDVTVGAGLIAAGAAVYLYLTSRAEIPTAPATAAGRIRIRPETRPGAATLVIGLSW